jgi:hypothetical protein
MIAEAAHAHKTSKCSPDITLNDIAGLSENGGTKMVNMRTKRRNTEKR